MAVRLMHVDAFGVSIHCPVVSLVDRRTPRPKSKEWLLTKAVETILFGPAQVLPRLFLGGHHGRLVAPHMPLFSLRAADDGRAV
jgi:hypothetical protein